MTVETSQVETPSLPEGSVPVPEISVGACANGGGPFKEGYNVVSGIDKYMPVDVYIPGCPPTPSALLQGVVALQEKIKKQSIRTVPWYQKDQRNDSIPVPQLGPDIFDPRDIPLIEKEREERKALVAEAPKKPSRRAPKPPKVPAWDITPTEGAQALADQINQTLDVAAVTPEKDALVVDPSHLIAVAQYIRDDLGYNYLSNVTGVDYLGRKGPRFEVVYHAYSIDKGGGPITFKARPADDDNPKLPSLVSLWNSANLQEREVYDLYGIRFEGHPNLKRILMWEGFHGHPMRKDFKEAYYEGAIKPFSNRWP